jgi:hypothetical protein
MRNVVSKYPVYCPVEGFTVFKVDYQPSGGGNEMWLISDEPLQIGDKLSPLHPALPCQTDIGAGGL